jgi:SsrA-binding protein
MGIKIICRNKRAGYDFFLEEKFEAGLVLTGTEVKVLREGKGNINDAFVQVDANGEAWVYNMQIPHYKFGNISNHEEFRKRKLLLSRKEITEIVKNTQLQRLTVVPVSLYFKDSKVKIEIALAKGKKMYDKRETEAKKDVERKLRQKNYE